MPLSCPNCRLINPPGSLRCDCGYAFDTQNSLPLNSPEPVPFQPNLRPGDDRDSPECCGLPPLHVRYGKGDAICGLIAGVILLAGMLLALVGLINSGEGAGMFLVFTAGVALFGGTTWFYAGRLIDRGPRLSLVPEGLRDHAEGRLIKWRDMSGFCLHTRTVNSVETAAVLRITLYDGQTLEVSVDSLEMSSSDLTARIMEYAACAQGYCGQGGRTVCRVSLRKAEPAL